MITPNQLFNGYFCQTNRHCPESALALDSLPHAIMKIDWGRLYFNGGAKELVVSMVAPISIGGLRYAPQVSFHGQDNLASLLGELGIAKYLSATEDIAAMPELVGREVVSLYTQPAPWIEIHLAIVADQTYVRHVKAAAQNPEKTGPLISQSPDGNLKMLASL